MCSRLQFGRISLSGLSFSFYVQSTSAISVSILHLWSVGASDSMEFALLGAFRHFKNKVVLVIVNNNKLVVTCQLSFLIHLLFTALSALFTGFFLSLFFVLQRFIAFLHTF